MKGTRSLARIVKFRQKVEWRVPGTRLGGEAEMGKFFHWDRISGYFGQGDLNSGPGAC
jgi:hypothetical protein